jgi:microcystin-dependent protein
MGQIVDTIYVGNYFKKFFPVGAIYISTVNTPPTFDGMTWAAFGQGGVLVGVDISDTDFNAASKTVGAKTHTLTVAQISSHTYTVHAYQTGGGSGGAHNNLQPYITVYMWKRTA